METVSDQILISKSKLGNIGAFEELVSRYASYCYSVVYRMVNVETEAEDIVQESLVKVWQKLKDYDEEQSKFSTWLYAIATRLAIDALRKRKQHVEIEMIEIGSNEPDGYNQLCKADLERSLKWVMSSLSELQKVVFVLREIEEMNVDEVTYITGLSPKQIKDNLYVARKQVRERMQKIKSL